MAYLHILLVLNSVWLIKANYRYPNCLQNLPTEISASNFNKNFLELTSFLFEAEDEELKLAAINATISQNYSEIDQIIVSHRMQYLLLFVSICCLCVIAFVIRTGCRKTSCLLLFTNKGIMKVINPCLVLLSVIIFIVLFIFMILAPNIYENYQNTRCILQRVGKIIKEGDLSNGWSGTNGYVDHFTLQLEYLNIIRSFPQNFDYSRQIIYSLIEQHQKFAQQLVYKYAEMEFLLTQQQKIEGSQLLPELLGSQLSLYNKINQSINNLISIAQISANIELSMINAKESASDAQTSLNTKIKYFQILASSLQFDLQSYISRDQVFRSIEETTIVPLMIKLFIVLGLICAASYSILICLNVTVNDSSFKKLSDIIWFSFLVQMIIGVIILYSLFQLVSKLAGQCYFFQLLKQDAQLYQTISKSGTGSVIAFNFLQPCLFGDGNFYDFTQSQHIQDSIKYLMTNMTLYRQNMKISNGNYQKAYTYKNNFDQAIDIIKKQQNNMRNNIPFLNNKLIQLNQYTYGQSTNNGCYNHKWAFDIEGCGDITTIIKHPFDIDLTDTSKEYCLLFYVKNGALDYRPLDFTQYIQFYGSSSYSEMSDCSSVFQKIIEIGGTITNSLSAISLGLQGLKEQLQLQQKQLKIFLQVLRKNYILKNNQYLHLATLGNTIQFDKHALKKWMDVQSIGSNCSVIKQQLNNSFEIFCLDLKADILKIYMITSFLLIIIAIIIVMGVQYGFNKQVQGLLETERQFENQDRSINSDNSQSPRKKIDSKRFIYQFFKSEKRRHRQQNK